MLNRRWTWGRSGPDSLRTEVLPFWGLEFLGWVVSTVAVDIAGQVSAGAGLGHLETTGAVAFAYVASFGVLWLGRFPVLDRVVFAEPTEVLEGA